MPVCGWSLAPVRRLDRRQLAAATRTLARRDPALGAAVSRWGCPPLWARPATFATLLRIVLEQQVSLASARAMFERLRAATSEVTPAAVFELGADGLRRLGFTRQKAAYACGLAERILSGQVRLAPLRRHGDAVVRDRLTAIPGIGPWTASIYLLMALRRPDVWPVGDLALHRSLQRACRLPHLPSAGEAAAMAMRWSPWRAVAARILWHAYLCERAARRPDGVVSTDHTRSSAPQDVRRSGVSASRHRGSALAALATSPPPSRAMSARRR
jgi:DNA-3-methyladenine glycosylase II